MTQLLPLEGTTSSSLEEEEEREAVRRHDDAEGREAKRKRRRQAKTIATPLPSEVRASLEVDEPIGLICVDDDDPSFRVSHSPSRPFDDDDDDEIGGGVRGDGDGRRRNLPLLCLYTRKSAFLLRIRCDPPPPPAHDRKAIGFGSEVPADSGSATTGRVLRVTEPFESHLLGCPPSTSIVRIRPAPSRRVGGGGGGGSPLLCPPGSMAMLTTECSLVLCHGRRPPASRAASFRSEDEEEDEGGEGTVTVPLSFGVEDVVDPSAEVVDFAFRTPGAVPPPPLGTSDGDSSSPALLAATTVLLLRKSGAVHAAGPILFDGTLAPRSYVRSARLYLQHEIETYAERAREERSLGGAKWRRAKASSQYLLDAFGRVDDDDNAKAGAGGGGYYVAARALNPESSRTAATTWPVRFQSGPILPPAGNDDDGYPLEYSKIESISTASSHLDGFVLGLSDGGGLDYAIIPSGFASTRFAFESAEDEDALDDCASNVAAVVERVSFLDEDDDEGGDDGDFATTDATPTDLVVDPIDDGTVHVVTRRSIATVRSDALSNAGRDAADAAAGTTTADGRRRRGERRESRTDAWSCLEVSSGGVGDAGGGVRVTGAAVSGDAHLGHVLVARLSNGSTEAVNLTAARYLRAAASLPPSSSAFSSDDGAPPPTDDRQPFGKLAAESDEALRAMESAPPFHEIAAPLLNRVADGLSSMGKIVGASTSPRNADASTVAVVLSAKERCESNVLAPLNELRHATESRTKALVGSYEALVGQIKNLKTMVKALKERSTWTREKLDVVEANGRALAQRSAAALTASRDLLPTITDAEHEYFSSLRRYEASLVKWENAADRARRETAKIGDGGTTEGLVAEAGGAAAAASKCDLDDEAVENCKRLLKGQGLMLRRAGDRVREMESIVAREWMSSGDDGGRLLLESC